MIDEHLILRNKLSSLQAAGQLAQAILHSQLPGKPTPQLYLLFRAYFKQIHAFEDPANLIVSFKLKLLKHEGLMALSPTCSLCDAPALYLLDGKASAAA